MYKIPYIWAILLGGLTSLSFAPIHWVPAGLVGIALFYLLMFLHLGAPFPPLKRFKLFLLGYCFGMGLFTASLYWISYSLFVDIERFSWVLPFCILGIPSLLSLFTGALTLSWALLNRLCRSTQPWLQTLWFALLWTGLEWLRGHLFTGFPWNLMGYGWLPFLPMAQLASLVGVYGLSFLFVFSGAALGCALRLLPHLKQPLSRKQWNAHLIPLAIAVVSVMMCWGWGENRLHQLPTQFHDIIVRLVQPNIDQKRKWKSDQVESIFWEHLDVSSKAHSSLGNIDPDFIIWPESACSWAPYYIEHDPFRRQLIANILPHRGYLISGAVRYTMERDGERISNGLIVLNKAGSVIATFDKFHLVPFGEYLPLRTWLEALFPRVIFRKITAGDRDFTPGPGPDTLQVGHLPSFSPLICYEAIFPHEVCAPQNRPQWLLNLTNDGWYGDSPGPYQHFQITRMRAIEEGLPLIRVANTGISGVVDAVGRVIEKTTLNTQCVLDSKLPQSLPSQTVYSLMGDSWILALFVVLAFVSYGFRKRFKV